MALTEKANAFCDRFILISREAADLFEQIRLGKKGALALNQKDQNFVDQIQAGKEPGETDPDDLDAAEECLAGALRRICVLTGRSNAIKQKIPAEDPGESISLEKKNSVTADDMKQQTATESEYRKRKRRAVKVLEVRGVAPLKNRVQALAGTTNGARQKTLIEIWKGEDQIRKPQPKSRPNSRLPSSYGGLSEYAQDYVS